MKTLLLFVTLIIGLSANAQRVGVNTEISSDKIEHDSLSQQRINEKETFDFYANPGDYQYKRCYLSTKKPVSAVVFEEDENKKIIRETSYKNGIYNGPSITWYSDGLKSSTENYINGEITGISRRWHRNGKLKSEFNHSGGDFTDKVYFFNQSIAAEIKYETDSIFTFKKKFPNGSLCYLDSNNHKREWNEKGILISESKDSYSAKEWFANGKIKYEQDTFLIKEYFENGQLKQKLKRSTVSTGYYTVTEEYYENGQQRLVIDGNNTFEYYANGQLKRNPLSGDLYYENGQLKQVKKNNSERKWHKNGQLAYESIRDLDNDIKTISHYDSDGYLLGSVTLKDGKGKLILQNKKGQIISETTYDGYEESIKEWFENGNLKYEKGWSFEKEYFENGQIKWEIDDLYYTEYYNNGQKKVAGGEFYGSEWISWYDNGEIKIEEDFFMQFELNIVRVWDRYGKLVSETWGSYHDYVE